MNVVLACAKTLNSFQLKVLEPFFESSRHKICGCVVDNRAQKSVFQRLKKNLKKGRGGYVLVMIFKSLFGQRIHLESTVEFMRRKKVSVIFTNKPHSENTIDKIKGFEPDIIILNGGFGIIKKPWLDTCKRGVLSYHHGDMRKYRGQPCVFWELYNGEKQIGMTVQKLSEGLDCGEAIVEKWISIKDNDTRNSLKKRVFDESAPMMYEAVNLLEKEDFVPEKIESFGKVYTIPNLRQWLMLNLKIGFRLVRKLWSGIV